MKRPPRRRSLPVCLPLLLGCALGLVFAPRSAHAFDPGRYAGRRPILGANEAGLYRVELDPALYRALAGRDARAQLRVLDAKSEQVPWALRRVPAVAAAESRVVTLVDPLSLPSGEARAVLDLGRPGLKHSELTLDVEVVAPAEGRGDFLRHVRLERSDDERHFQVLADGLTIFRAATSGVPAESLVLRYPVSDARYLRVVVLPAAAHQRLAIRGATLAFVPPAARPPERALAAELGPRTRDAASKTSALTLDFGAPGVPLEAVALGMESDAFERWVSIDASNEPPLWVPTTSA